MDVSPQPLAELLNGCRLALQELEAYRRPSQHVPILQALPIPVSSKMIPEPRRPESVSR